MPPLVEGALRVSNSCMPSLLFRALPRALVVVTLGLSAVACGDDDGHDHGDAGGDYGPSCGEIIGACHDVDDGTGRISECHDIAHEEVESACAPIVEECVALCVAAAADGGAHDHDGGAHDEDAGAHEH